MSGTINSLGLGSGVLTSDLLDKLRGADEANIIKPLDNKITLNQQKGQTLDLLNSLLSSFKSSVNALDNDTLYQKRSVTGGNDGMSVSAATGSQIRDFSLNVTNIAKKNVLQSGTYTSSSTLIGSGTTGNGKLNIGIGGNNYSIDYNSTTTLDSLKQTINDVAGKDVTASVLQTGTSAYTLVLTSKNTGANQVISLSNISGNLDSKLLTPTTKSGPLLSKDYPIASASGSMTINVDGISKTIDYVGGTALAAGDTKLTDLVNTINNDTTLNTKISANIVQFAANDYRLVLTPRSGVTNSITITDSNGTLDESLLTNPRSELFVNATTTIANTGTSGNFNLTIGGATVAFAYTDSTTLQNLVDDINGDAIMNTKVTASIVSYGAGDVRMVLTPKAGSVGSTISYSDSAAGLKSALKTLSNAHSTTNGSMQIIQDSKDAHFTFDGISMSRSTNTITDIANGLTVNLLKDSASANISITQNRDQIATEMTSMVSSYNTLIKQLGDMTGYNAKEGKVGIFNGDNTIKNISREITKIITSYNSSGRSLPQYGIDLSKDGVMSFNQSVFTTKMDSDPTGTEEFFSGKTTLTSIGKTSTSSFVNATSLISSGGSGTMSLKIGSASYSLPYTATTTLQQITDAINADSGLYAKVTASIVQYNTNSYQMVLTPKDSGIGELISISDSTGGSLVSSMKTLARTNDVITYTKGVFTSLNDQLKAYNSSSGLLYNLTTASKEATTSLNEDRTKANKLLEARYATMQAKFAAYDSMISKLNSQFSSLKQQIDAQANAANG